MIDSKDFEALGRYVDAKERATGIESLRHNLAGDLTRLLNKAVANNGSDRVNKFDHAQFLAKAQELAGLNQDLTLAIEQVNLYAGPAGKSGITQI